MAWSDDVASLLGGSSNGDSDLPQRRNNPFAEAAEGIAALPQNIYSQTLAALNPPPAPVPATAPTNTTAHHLPLGWGDEFTTAQTLTPPPLQAPQFPQFQPPPGFRFGARPTPTQPQ
jgi:hypothetical protein